MTSSVMQRAFAGGELAPALHARADQAKYLTGLRRCRNFLVQRHGGATNRAGFRFVAACKTTASTVKLMRYVSEIDGQSLLLEHGNGYIRFFKNGAAVQVVPGDISPWDVAVNYVVGDLVTRGGVTYYARVVNVGVMPPSAATWYPLTGTVYEIPSPFPAAHLPNWVQSGRTITLTHADEPPVDLVYQALTRWVIRPVTTASAAVAPVGLVLTPAAAGARKYGYVVTAALPDTYEESVASGQVVNAAVSEPTNLAPHVLTWTAVAGAPEYYVYADPYGNGTYGFIGTSSNGAVTFRDGGITPDFAITPPLARVLFASVNGYPAVCAYYQQRRFFAYTNNNPDSIFASRTGLPSNFGISSPVQDDDALTFRIAGNNHNPVRHLLAVKGLIVLTDAGEWTVTSGDPKQPLLPNAIDADQQTYVGAAPVPPVIVGNAMLYVQARGKILCDLRFDIAVEGLGGRDLSVFAAHLTDNFRLTEIAYAQTPHSIVWAVRSDGTLLGLTYLRDQDVWGWHRHDTGAGGVFEHVCVVPESGEDALYVIVKRTIGAATVRYIERLASRQITVFDTDAFFVDSGLSYSGAPATTVSGLGHLEGQLVAVVADGAVIFDGRPITSGDAVGIPAQYLVTAGAITLSAAYSNIHVGLAITAELETLDLDVQAQTVLRDKKKRVGSVRVLLDESSRSFLAGPDAATLVRYTLEPSEQPADSFTGQVEVNLTSAFNDYGRVFLQQRDPLPLTVLGIVPNLELGG